MAISDELRQFLQELELNEVESEVYLATLELGSGAASAIANAAKLNRITAYEALKRLSKKGFVKIRAKKSNGVRYFVPEDIGVIKEKLEERKKKLEATIKHADVLKDELRARFRLQEEKPVVLFYEGEEGVREVLSDTLKQSQREIISFSSVEAVTEGFKQEFVQKYWDKRVALGIPSRGIIEKTEAALRAFSPEKNKRELRTVRFLSPELYRFTGELDVYGDSVGITSHEKGNEHGIIIRSRSIAENMRALFETLWRLGENAD